MTHYTYFQQTAEFQLQTPLTRSNCCISKKYAANRLAKNMVIGITTLVVKIDVLVLTKHKSPNMKPLLKKGIIISLLGALAFASCKKACENCDDNKPPTANAALIKVLFGRQLSILLAAA